MRLAIGQDIVRRLLRPACFGLLVARRQVPVSSPATPLPVFHVSRIAMRTMKKRAVQAHVLELYYNNTTEEEGV